MSHLSKQKTIKRKRRQRKERNKFSAAFAAPTSTSTILTPLITLKKGLRITTAPLKKIKHLPITIGNNKYTSAADLSINHDMLKYWGKAIEITHDIHGNYIVYWKERFPLFDEFDYNLDERHFRVMLICSSQQDAEEKMKILAKTGLHISDFGQNKVGFHSRFQEKYKHFLPFFYYEDSVRVIAVEAL